MGIEKLFNLQTKIKYYTEEVERKKFLDEPVEKDLNKLRMLGFDLQKEVENLQAELKWRLSLISTAEKKINEINNLNHKNGNNYV